MKEIKLTQGFVALVDDEDYDYLNQWKWFANRDKGTGSYNAGRNAPTVNGKRGMIRMHRQILGITDPKVHGDHINHNTLDNQRQNLRIANHSESMANRRSHKSSTSKYKGVCWSSWHKKWAVTIKENRKQKHLGYFENELEAALIYNKAAKKIYGGFAYLNKVA